MSLPSPLRQTTFSDACVLFEDLFSTPSDRYRLFREKIWPCLWAKRAILAELYCQENGRPAIEPVVMLGATLLQIARYNHTGRTAVLVQYRRFSSRSSTGIPDSAALHRPEQMRDHPGRLIHDPILVCRHQRILRFFWR